MAAGRMDASMAIVEPVNGSVSLDQSPDQILTPANPDLKLERSATPTMGYQDPTMTMNGPGR